MSSITEVIVQNEKKTFVENVQKWLLYEQQLKLVTDKAKQIRESKNATTESICRYMQTHGLSQNKIKITDGELKICDRKEYSPLTYTYVEECLAKIIPEKESVEFIMDYLKQNREIKITREIRKTTNK
uniref:Uncharacterized protein n=1 Tax=viral metagenome TaxID=1070528 RepID=A0A6C0D5V6_9ZZZZ